MRRCRCRFWLVSPAKHREKKKNRWCHCWESLNTSGRHSWPTQQTAPGSCRKCEYIPQYTNRSRALSLVSISTGCIHIRGLIIVKSPRGEFEIDMNVTESNWAAFPLSTLEPTEVSRVAYIELVTIYTSSLSTSRVRPTDWLTRLIPSRTTKHGSSECWGFRCISCSTRRKESGSSI